jgi:hypothetical protein
MAGNKDSVIQDEIPLLMVEKRASEKAVKLPWPLPVPLTPDGGFDIAEDPAHPSRKIYGNWFELLSQGIPNHLVGAQVLQYCRSNESVRAFVFFSLSEEVVRSLVETLSEQKEIVIVYAANLELTEFGCLNLIELCYGDKPFFNEHVKKKMSRERFASSLNAFVLVFDLKDSSRDLRSIKTDLRSTLSQLMFERRIHGTDQSEDTVTLVEAITNPNTLDLLNKVKVSRKERVFSRAPDFLRGNPNACLDGSSVMELYGLRKSRDLDIICSGLELQDRIISSGFDINHMHYKWLPIKPEQIIYDPHLHLTLFGLKFTSLGVRQLILEFRLGAHGREIAPKKLRDLKLIYQFRASRGTSKVTIFGVIATASTQFRLLLEFLIVKLVPHLPTRLVGVVRRARTLLVSRLVKRR